MVRKVEIVKTTGIAGGKGSAELHMIVNENELCNSGSMYAKVVLAPGASIGWHQHVGETEPYYILSGNGVFTDNDGSRIPVSEGDVCTILPGQSHALENSSDIEPLSLMALIYKDNRF